MTLEKMTLEKITLSIYHPEVKEFIEKGQGLFQDACDIATLSRNEEFWETHMNEALKIYKSCLSIQKIIQQFLTPDKIWSDILLAASFFCDLFVYHPKSINCPEYRHLIAIGELEKVTLGPNQTPVCQAKWWFTFKRCLLYAAGTFNPLKMLNFDKPISELDVIFMLGYQLQFQEGKATWLN